MSQPDISILRLIQTFNFNFNLLQNSSKIAHVEVDVGGLNEPQRGGIGLAHASPLSFLL